MHKITTNNYLSTLNYNLIMSLTLQDKSLLNRKPHVSTQLGMVATLGFDEDIPFG